LLASGAFFSEEIMLLGSTAPAVLRPFYCILNCFADLNLCCEQLKNNIDLNTTHLGNPVGNFPKNPHRLATLGKARRKLEENSEEKQNSR